MRSDIREQYPIHFEENPSLELFGGRVSGPPSSSA